MTTRRGSTGFDARAVEATGSSRPAARPGPRAVLWAAPAPAPHRWQKLSSDWNRSSPSRQACRMQAAPRSPVHDEWRPWPYCARCRATWPAACKASARARSSHGSGPLRRHSLSRASALPPMPQHSDTPLVSGPAAQTAAPASASKVSQAGVGMGCQLAAPSARSALACRVCRPRASMQSRCASGKQGAARRNGKRLPTKPGPAPSTTPPAPW